MRRDSARGLPALMAIAVGGLSTLATCSEPIPQLDGWVAGCADVEDGPTCVLGDEDEDRRITAWVKDARAPVRVSIDGAAVAVTVTSTRGGLELSLSPAVGQLVATAPNGRFVARITRTESADPADVATSTRARARLRAGDWRGAVEDFDHAAGGHARQGAWSRAVRDMQAAAYALLYAGHQPHEARRRLERAQPWLRHDRDGWAIHPYYRALHAIRAADPTTAIAELGRARRRLAGRGATVLVAGVDETLAVVLQQMGRDREAAAVVERLRGVEEGGPCARARRLNNAAWAGLLAADGARRAPSPQTRAALAEALAGYERPECRAAPGRQTALLHRAMAALIDGRFREVQEVLRDLPESDTRLDTRLWRLEIEARTELGLGRPAVARARLQDALARLPSGELPDAEWRLEVWLARALRAEGRVEEALQAHRRADTLLDDGALRIPFGEGRAPFAEARRRGAVEWAELLLDRGDAAGAACVVRRARARAVSRAAQDSRIRALSPAARAAWEEHIGALRELRAESERAAQDAWGLAASELQALQGSQSARRAAAQARLSKALGIIEAVVPAGSCAALRSPDPGELLLVFTRGSKGWLGFAITEDGTRAERFGAESDPRERLSRFDRELEAAKRVRWVVEQTPALARPHAWPWRGRPLNAQRPVVFALDLPVAPGAPAANEATALIVADPERNLAGARQEARAVQAALDERGWLIERLEGSAARPEVVRDALQRSALLHFAGHGHASEASPWGDRLGLHRGALDVQDILTSDRVPAAVVLTGCRTAVEPSLEELERVGVAQAFLLAGARQVLGSTRDVPDDLAREVGRGVYLGAPQQMIDLAKSFHSVAQRLDSRGDGRWVAFRVWVP